MAEEFVSKEQFGEFVQRMEDRFDHVYERFNHVIERTDDRFLSIEKRMDQGFSHAEKNREQDFAHLQAEIRRLWNLTLALHVPVVVAIVAAAVKYLFFK